MGAIDDLYSDKIAECLVATLAALLLRTFSIMIALQYTEDKYLSGQCNLAAIHNIRRARPNPDMPFCTRCDDAALLEAQPAHAMIVHNL